MRSCASDLQPASQLASQRGQYHAGADWGLTCPMPSGSLCRVLFITFAKLTYTPCAVSGRRNACVVWLGLAAAAAAAAAPAAPDALPGVESSLPLAAPVGLSPGMAGPTCV